MIYCIGQILSPDQLAHIRTLLARAKFRPGHETAGWSAREVKQNLQLSSAEPQHSEVSRIILAALNQNEIFAGASLPKIISPLLISRSDRDMGYGPHVDNALMGNPMLRTDLAFTLFISEEDSYEGGELVIDDAQGEQALKLPAGSMVLYPATTLHRVEKVLSGQRLVAAGWVQSLVRDPRIREMLFDLDAVRKRLFTREGKTPDFDLLSKTYANLLRQSAEL
ncbi:MAG: Fe2+-dependent dioxygenase [Rhizobiales bacterium]|nr:Fe2+-dependent dioxygenase [Hyphomicrobiales bacterium]